MPKGDREILKADPEDGTTPIANLLLEALAMAHLSGEEKGAVLFLLRRTYGWELVEGRRKTEDKITLTEWALALNTNPQYASRVIAALAQKRVILRRDLGQGKGYSYSMKTRVNQWDEGCLNSEELSKRYSEGLSKKYRVPSTKKIIPPDMSLAMAKESIKESIKESTSTKVEGDKSPDSLAAQTPASRYLFEKTGRKRWKNLVQKEEFEKVEAQVGEARMKEAIDWALLSGISNVKSILTAAKKGSKHGDAGRGPGPGRGAPAHRQDPHAAAREAGWQVGEDDQGGDDTRDQD